MVFNPAFSTETLTPTHNDHARESVQHSPSTWSDLNLTIRADRQYVNLQQDHLVAEGNVRLRLAGGDLAADWVTYGRSTGLLTAIGAVRLWRGSQYIQASMLRYNLETQTGELRDVYGVINFDHHAEDLSLWDPETQSIPQLRAVDPDVPWAELPPMACPLLQPPSSNRSINRASVEQQSLVPPLGCPNPDGHAQHYQDLDHLPEWVISGSGPKFRLPSLQTDPTLEEKLKSPEADQRVHEVTSNTGLELEYRLGFADRDEFNETQEDEQRDDPVVPHALSLLERSQILDQERSKDKISNWRFQAEALFLTPETWTSPLVVLTNDPLTPAGFILEGRDSQVRQEPDGSLVLTSATNRALLDRRLSVPLPRRIDLNNDRPAWALFGDEAMRDGLYIQRRAAPYPLLGGELVLRPQFLLERALSGKTDIYPAGHSSPEADPIQQDTSVGDLFGLDVRYRRPIGTEGQLHLSADFSTLSPQHLANGTRAKANLSHPLTLPLLGETKATLSAAYRFSVWNGSLGEQDIYTAFGGFLEKDYQLPPLGPLRNHLFWRLGLQNINTTVFDTKDLSGKTWRASGYARLTSTLPIWQGEILEDSRKALRYAPSPVRPEISLKTFLIAQSSSYGDRSSQRYYTLGILSDVTAGHFSRPYLDYTNLSIGGSVSVVEELSRFSFDRVVDLGLLHVSLTQQVAGPLLLGASMSYNVDRGSKNYGRRVDSIFELKWQRRAYSMGLFYSPERRLGGIQIRLNGFDWSDTGTPFIPYTPSSWIRDN